MSALVLLAAPAFLLSCLLAVLVGFSLQDARLYPSSRWAFRRDAAIQALVAVALMALALLIAFSA